MKLLKLFAKGKRKKRIFSDYYQESINRVGREQFRRLVDKGLSIPVGLL